MLLSLSPVYCSDNSLTLPVPFNNEGVCLGVTYWLLGRRSIAFLPANIGGRKNATLFAQ